MIKKKLLMISILSLSLICGSLVLSSINNNSFLGLASNNDRWVHYNKVNASSTQKGIKEYWINCSTDEHQFSAPSSGNIVNGGTPNRSFIDSLDSDDDRLIDPYSNFDFENGRNSYISIYDRFTSLEVVDGEGIGGSKALRAGHTGSAADCHLKIDKGFLDYAFSDSNVKALSFYAKGTLVTNNFRHKQVDKSYVNNNSDIISCYERNMTGYGITNDYKEFYLTRGVYSQMSDSDWFIQYGGIGNDYLYLDNFSISYHDYYDYKFNSLENGIFVLEENNTTHRLRHPSNGQADFNIINRVGTFGDGGNASLAFDYENYTDGVRSMKLTKPNGEFDYHLLGNYSYGNISSEGGVIYDIYSSIVVNASFDENSDGYYEKIGNFQDGFAGNVGNGSKVIHKGQIRANTWYTLFTPKSQFSSNGRFFVINGSTPGSFNIDNIRLVDKYLYSNAGVVNLINGEDITISTSLNISSFDSLSIDHLRTTSYSINGNNINIPSSLLSEGIHEINVSYRSNNQFIYETIYVEGVSLSTEPEKNVTINYGDNGYYTLSGYSGIYRIMSLDKEVPFEVDGSSYLIPNAALVELLPAINNKKVSGTVRLKLFSLTSKYVLPINITVGNSVNVNNIPNYQGEGIGTHAYSSSCSLATRTNYQPYFNKEKIVEFQNTGLEMMYEQAISVGMYEYTLNDADKYLFNNAYELNQKVMPVDYSFTLLSRYNVSIINTPLYETVDTYGEPQTTANKYSNNYVPTYGSDRMFKTTDELDAFVEYRLKLYIDYPACYGVNVGDEQTYSMLSGGYKDLLASIHRVLTKLGREDFYINSNLNPITASDYRLTGVVPSGGDQTTASYSEANYINYLNAFVSNSGLNYVQFDAYPFTSSDKGGIYEKKGMNQYYIKNLLVVAEYCKTHNLDLYMVTQSVTYYGTRILDRKDISWINNMALGMGVKHISYFVYCVRSNTGSEVWLDDSAFLGVNGNRNDLYYYFQSQIHEINQFSNTISAFDYKWMKLYKRTTYNTSKIYTNAQGSSYYPSSSSFGELSSVSTSKDWTLVTGLQSNTDNKYMYMVQNVYNSFSNELLQTVTLSFNKSYSYAVIYESGLPRVVTLGSNSLQLKLSAGRAAFVMVY